MCGYCGSGPPDFLDVELYINTGQVDNDNDAIRNLTAAYWEMSCSRSQAVDGWKLKRYGIHWRDYYP